MIFITGVQQLICGYSPIVSVETKQLHSHRTYLISKYKDYYKSEHILFHTL